MTKITGEFAEVASESAIMETAQSLMENGFNVQVVGSVIDAKKTVEKLVPKGVEVYTTASKTTEQAGIKEMLDESGNYTSVRKLTEKLDFKDDFREIIKNWSTPEYMVGSVHALTRDGHALIASRSNSQLPGYANGAAHVVWVVGAQKIVDSVDEGIKRIKEYVVNLEDKRIKEVYGKDASTKINSILIKYAEDQPRTNIVIVKEAVGF